MYRDNLEQYVNMCRLRRVPTEPQGQDELIRALRYTLWTKRYDELQALFMTCGMGESEIIERRRFYLEFAPLIGRLVVLIPSLHQYFMLDYIAEDMIDGGDPELVAAGQRLQTVLQHAKAGAKDIRGRVLMPAYSELKPEVLEHYRRFPGEFLARVLEANWEYDSDRSYGLAAAIELLSLEKPEMPLIGPILMQSLGDYSSPEHFFAVFAATTVSLLNNAGYSEWAQVCQQVFAPLTAGFDPAKASAAKAVADAGDGSGHSEADFGPLSLGNISAVWKKEGVAQALVMARQRLLMTPEDPFACGMLGDIYLAQMNVPLALACLSRAWHRAPDSPVVLHVLGQAFQAGYFAAQVDLCRRQLSQLPEFQANPRPYQFGVELFLKCDVEETQVAVNGSNLGLCPLQIRNVRPGTLNIQWKLKNGREKRFSVTVEEATVAKFRYHPDSDSVSDEISRDGVVTVFTPEGSKTLNELIPEFLVTDLANLPDPTIEQCLGS